MPNCLSIVLPALNEEEALESTLRRTLDARDNIIASGGVARVEILVVNDGSTDRTEEIARSMPDVKVLSFAHNRGYGAAIKCGFAHATGDLLGFLDADGTCEPASFGNMCKALEEQRADLVVGGRRGAKSEMPWIRNVGNALFAWMLGLLSRRRIGDVASGMRVIRRSALPFLYPLPDGLHFTPAMSARVLLEDRLKLVEVPIPYAERVGQSKLSVLRDGFRFLQVIFLAALCYRPARPLLLTASVALAMAGLVAVSTLIRYVGVNSIEPWLIYRFLLAALLTTVGWVLVCSAVLGEGIAALAHDRPVRSRGPTHVVSSLFSARASWAGIAASAGAALVLVWPGIVEYMTTGSVYMHWSRAVEASLLTVVAALWGTTRLLLTMLDLIAMNRVGEPAATAVADRVFP